MLNSPTQDRISNQESGSIKKRYLFKLSTNIIGVLISFCTQGIIPRALGPKSFGDFNFLTNSFTQIISLFDAGSSTAFYTKLSNRPREHPLVSFYIFYIAFVALIVISFVFISHITGLYIKFWPDQAIPFIYLAAIWSISTWLINIFSQMLDAYGLTIPAEKVKILQKFLILILVIVMFYKNLINLANFFYLNYIVQFFLIIGFLILIVRFGNSLHNFFKISRERVNNYLKEFYHYCHPLFIFSIIVLITNILDRWLLQVFSGSIEQGFFSLSSQISGVCVLFTSSITPLLMREFSIAYQDKNFDQMSSVFQIYLPIMFSIASYFSCFMLIQSENLIEIFGGKDFSGAFLSVAIMSLYPIHQTYGQLNSSLLYATEQTVLYRNLGIVFMLLGLPITYILIAPRNVWGLNAGATGLAIKMVLMNLIAVNAQLFYNARFLKISFWKFIFHQILCITILIFLSVAATTVTHYFLDDLKNCFVDFAFSGIIYTLFTLLIGFYWPGVFGLTRERIKNIIRFSRNERI